MSLRRSLFISFGQRYSVLVFQLASSMIIARLLTPAQIGLFSVAMAAVAIAQVVRDFGVSRYLVQEPDLTRERVRTVFGLMIVLSWSLAGLLFATRFEIAQFYEHPELEGLLSILCLAFVVTPFGSIVGAQLTREMQFGSLWIITVPGTVVGMATGIALAANGHGAASLAWGALAQLVAVAALSGVMRPDLMWLLPSLREWRRVLSFGSYAAAASLFSQLAIRAPDLVLGRLMGFAAVGYYSRATGITDMFQQNVVAAVDAVAFPAVAGAMRGGTRLEAPYLRTVACMTALSWTFYGLLALMAFPVIRLLFGDQWDPVVPLVQFLCVARMVRALTPITGSMLTGLGKVKTNLRVEMMAQVVSVPLLLVAAFHSLEAVAASRIVAATVVVLLHMWALRRHIGVSGGDALRASLPSLWVSALALVGPATVAATVAITPDSLVAPFAIACGLCTMGWLIGLRLVQHPLWDEIRTRLLPACGGIWRRLQRGLAAPR